MGNRLARIAAAVLLAAPPCLPLRAQAWDAPSQARSWAKQDRDDSFTFYDPSTRMLHTWAREVGTLASLPLPRLEEPPERWLLDPRGSAWVAHGHLLTQFDRSGRQVNSLKLPAEVGDVCWDAKGFVISYRTREPYLEKRDFLTRAILWSFGAKPDPGDDPLLAFRRPVLMDDAGNVLMADGPSLNLAVLEGRTGRKIAETTLLLASGQPAPLLEGPAMDRGPLALWPGRGVVLAALSAALIPASQRESIQGLALARLDLPRARLEFLATGLDEHHVLVGVLGDEAVFASPKGGLMVVKIR